MRPPHWSPPRRGVLAYLGGSELLGMKAKSRRGKKSLGPIIPKPLVRFGCILRSRNKPREPCRGRRQPSREGLPSPTLPRRLPFSWRHRSGTRGWFLATGVLCLRCCSEMPCAVGGQRRGSRGRIPAGQDDAGSCLCTPGTRHTAAGGRWGQPPLPAAARQPPGPWPPHGPTAKARRGRRVFWELAPVTGARGSTHAHCWCRAGGFVCSAPTAPREAADNRGPAGLERGCQ